ncbi:MAG: molybdopterin molybdotransferase MoeA [Lachnospiraceae bacterium]
MKPDFSDLITKEEALSRLFSCWDPQPVKEVVSLDEAAGRVLFEDQYALYNIPVVRASTMDGIAVRSECFRDGMPDTSGWRMGTDFVRADTGDDFDDAFDTVIAIEKVTFLENGGIQIDPHVNTRPGFNVKPCGADVKKGALLVKKGTVLSASDLAAIAMGGLAEVPVVRKPRVSFLPTGSELVPAGEPLQRGKNFDSNSVMVAQMLREMGAVPILHPIVKDDRESLNAALEELMPQSDIVLVNAGTSKGGEDYCAGLLEQKGHVLFHGVAAVPGRPMSMAMIDGLPVVNLSGPPFAAFYSMDWAVRTMVCRMLGIPVPVRETVEAVLTSGFHMPPLSLMACFHLEKNEAGEYLATQISLRGPRSAGSAAALTADAVYVTVPGEKHREAGEKIILELMKNRSGL